MQNGNCTRLQWISHAVVGLFASEHIIGDESVSTQLALLFAICFPQTGLDSPDTVQGAGEVAFPFLSLLTVHASIGSDAAPLWYVYTHAIDR